MKIEKTYTFAYSVKGTTKKLINEMSSILPNVEYNDLTRKAQERETNSQDLVVVGAPVYSGRIPKQLAERLRSLKGNNTPAVAVVVYGNRAYDDALLELKDTLTKQGFKVIAGLVYVAEHSLSRSVATGRPDENDLAIALSYTKQILEKLDSIKTPDDILPLEVPGNFPYVKVNSSPKAETAEDLNPLSQKLADMFLSKVFKGVKQPEIYI